MMMEIHGYTRSGEIDATINGVRATVPDDMGNRHRRMIAAWEAQSNAIPAYVAPTPPTNDETDTATLAAAMVGGRFEKAIAEVLRTEINAVRAALPTPLPAKTKGQINAALKIAMRNGA